jgi:D-alanine-D-alanine ligase
VKHSWLVQLRTDLEPFRAEIRDLRIGVVYGPKSREDAFYIANSPPELLTVTHICETLEGLGLSFGVIDPCNEDTFVAELDACDLMFLVCHGEFGEDGRLQGLLDYLGKPYTGSGVAASAVGIDKLLCKLVLSGAGIATPEYVELDPDDGPDASLARVEAAFPPPWIAKPVTGGSSIGVSVAHTAEALLEFLGELPPAEELRYFVEPFLAGRIITAAILEAEPGLPITLPLIEVTQEREFYDAETKLDRGLASPHYGVPTDLPADAYAEVERLALRTYSVLGCLDFARVDFVVSRQTPLVLEVNTIPGMSLSSGYRAAMEHGGLSSEEVVLALLRSAWQRGPAAEHGDASRRGRQRLAG